MSRAMVATAQNMVMDEGGGIVREEAIRQRRARGVRRGGGRGRSRVRAGGCVLKTSGERETWRMREGRVHRAGDGTGGGQTSRQVGYIYAVTIDS